MKTLTNNTPLFPATQTHGSRSKYANQKSSLISKRMDIGRRTFEYSASNFSGRLSGRFPKNMKEAKEFLQFQGFLSGKIDNPAACLPEKKIFDAVEIKAVHVQSKIDSHRTERGLFTKKTSKKAHLFVITKASYFQGQRLRIVIPYSKWERN